MMSMLARVVRKSYQRRLERLDQLEDASRSANERSVRLIGMTRCDREAHELTFAWIAVSTGPGIRVGEPGREVLACGEVDMKCRAM